MQRQDKLGHWQHLAKAFWHQPADKHAIYLVKQLQEQAQQAAAVAHLDNQAALAQALRQTEAERLQSQQAEQLAQRSTVTAW
jgi:hypothetical protein